MLQLTSWLIDILINTCDRKCIKNTSKIPDNDTEHTIFIFRCESSPKDERVAQTSYSRYAPYSCSQ